MAFLALGREFHRYEKDLYKQIIEKVSGKVHEHFGDIRIIKFNSEKFGAKEYCAAIIKKNKYTQCFEVSKIVLSKYALNSLDSWD